ncbi:Uncharacterised protein [Chlamydia trachomatis]|nr:Uncharacterised protein [Chlamydia trachomatis]
MWAISKRKVGNFIDRITESMHLDTKKILTWYSYVLFIAPLLFWAMIAISTIVAIVDFILGYYMLLNHKQFLINRQTYRFLMGSQMIAQLFVGNLLCVVLAILGFYRARALKKTQDGVSRVIIAISLTAAGLLLASFMLILLLEF